MPELYIIAGCNGAGKTTAAFTLLPNVFQINEFVNADEIARGLSPFNEEGAAFQAGRIMLLRIGQLIGERKSFAFETTLSGSTYIKFIEEAKLKGYSIVLLFVHLASVELAIERVRMRVFKGGHDIPSDVIERRYYKGLHNFFKYANLCTDWYVYDNSGKEYLLVAKEVNGETEIINFEVYSKLGENEY